ncbi:penicillin-binding transpeptidase domain-containing protein [Candidatus Protofrankia californiensis]|uniref:penicillin-binding transpeptidase domain-containing protein n=1 Tax=Candidatus Protofrankia californiensis TaxID=1839754 RepID=UPI0013E9EF6E|nr:penicillin-binding transpeptidase domain-containing protein [Candidatus Protofrankia californiensis]
MPLTPSGFTASTSRRGRGRTRLLVAFVVVIVLLAAAGAGYLWKIRSDNRALDRAATAAAGEYLSSWQRLGSSGDTATADQNAATAVQEQGKAGVTAVTVPGAIGVDQLVTSMIDIRARLNVTGVRFVPGTLERTGSTATVGYSASLTLAGFPEPYTYDGVLHLVRQGKAWKVQARPDSVNPALVPGLRLDRTASTGKRGRLIDVSGQPLSSDAELVGNLVGQVSPSSGLQRVYDADLAPHGGTVVVRNERNETVNTLRSYPMTDGKDVQTTLDLKVQRAAEAAMATAPKPNGALVAVDTQTGGVLALVNNPLNGYSRALRGNYPPGSTFKIVTATAALIAGKDANTPLDCTQTVPIGGRTFTNAEAEQFGVIPLREAFAHSCNTAFIRLEESLPNSALEQAAKLYGFDGSQPLPIASASGSFPTPKDAVESASAALGQGKVSASPLQMASVAAAVASGTWRQPFVTGTAAKSNPLPAAVVPPLQDFMRAVVTEGTATGVVFPGEVRGKTGTAEYKDGDPPPTHGWFVGYRGNIAFAVIVEDGGFGAVSAAPVAARFLENLGGV